MFVSPCTLRSTQCAALIALAAVAGIARVETNHRAQRTTADSASTTQAHLATRPALQLFNYNYNASARIASWLQPVATVALWFFNSHQPARADHSADLAVAASHTSDSDSPSNPESAASSFFATALPAAPIVPRLAPLADSGSLSPRTEPQVATCTISHLIPFAVGPPCREVTSHPLAASTPVLGNSTANGRSERSLRTLPRVAPADDVSSLARLARLSAPSLFPLGLDFGSGFALRGEPARPAHSVPGRPFSFSSSFLT